MGTSEVLQASSLYLWTPHNQGTFRSQNEYIHGDFGTPEQLTWMMYVQHTVLFSSSESVRLLDE